MPIRLGAPVLTVDAGKMHQIDTSNVENLFSMWTGQFDSFTLPLPRLTAIHLQYSIDAQSPWKKEGGSRI